MISIMEDITKFSFLKTLWYLRDYLSEQFKQYVHGTFRDLIDKMGLG